MIKTGKITVLDAPGAEFRIREHELPDVQPGTALITSDMCGLCGTDVHYWAGHRPTIDLAFPGVIGHEMVGTVSAVFELSDDDVYDHLTGEIRRRFGGNMPDQLWDEEKNTFHKKIRAFRDGKALDATDARLRDGEELTFYLMMAGG